MRILCALPVLLAAAPLLFGQQPGTVAPAGAFAPPAKLTILTDVAPPPDTKPAALPPVTATITPAAPVSSPIISFDPQQARLRWDNGRWEIYAGNVRLQDFGNREQAAQDALNVIRQLRLSQHGTVGRPVPIMEYWLSDGQAPHTLSGGGLRLFPIDRQSLRVDQVQGQWCVLDDRRLLFNFGPLEADARQALTVIRDHAFDQIGYVGLPQPAMIYFVAGQTGVGQPSLHSGQTGLGQPSLHPDSLFPQALPKKDLTSSQANGAGKATPQPGTANNEPSKMNPFLLKQLQLASQGQLQLAPPPTAGVTRVRFDPHDVAVRQENGAWRLYVGSRVVADFRDQALQAQAALKLLKDYGCNEQCMIGVPTPTMSYFLANGHAPLGTHHDLQGRPFQPDKINVRQHLESWYICEGDQPLLFFGERKQDAQELAAAVKRYRFDFISQMGAPGQPAFSLLVRRQ